MIRSLYNKTADTWLKNAVLALGIAGIYSIILVILRTPLISQLIQDKTIFQSTLIVHVNLSVLVWLLSVCCVFWSYNIKHSFLSKLCSKLAYLATITIAIAPFTSPCTSIMNNYIPMLDDNIIFAFGLSLFGCIILILAVNTIFETIYYYKSDIVSNNSILRVAAITSSLIFIITSICFVISHLELQSIINTIEVDMKFYYEILYWSGGHLLQFLFCQILIIVWVVLINKKTPKFVKLYSYILITNCIFASFGLLAHFMYDVISAEFREYYTQHMRYLGGIAPMFAFAIILYEILLDKTIKAAYLNTGIICSGLMFAFGGIVALSISGTNVTIPAHYHGSIVSITIACMAFTYLFYNKFITKNRIHTIQIYAISIGQFLHISGLAAAGGYGVLRKTPYTELTLYAKIAMSVMGVGGILAIIGGLIFVATCVKSFFIIEPKSR